MFGSRKRLEKQLRQSGTRAPATVLDFHRLATETINGPGRVSSVVMICRLKSRMTAAQGALDAFTTATTTATPPTSDPLDQLAKLAELRDGGALSDGEFADQKKRILGES